MMIEDPMWVLAKKDNVEDRSVVYGLKDQINKLETLVKNLTVEDTAKKEKAAKKNKKKNNGASASEQPSAAIFDLLDGAGTSSGTSLSEDEKLRRLVKEVQEDVRQKQIDLPVLQAKMERVNKLWNEVMVEEMRSALKESVGQAVVTLQPAEITEKNVIAAMDGEGIPDMTLAEYKKKPEQPKGVSRNVWMGHLKMAKKFAECIAHMCAVHKSGRTDNLDWATTEPALASVELWEEKWADNAPMMKNIHHLVAYEIIQRVKDLEYYNCLFCNVVEFNVMQFLSHFASGTHCKVARVLISSEEKIMTFGFAAKQMINLTMVCDDLHGYYSQQFTTPLVKSGAKVPQPSKNSIPTVEYLAELEEKYGKAINGELDETKFKDAAYVASKLPGIVERHKSDIGKQLFKELSEYLEKGTSIYCRRCHWKVSNRKSFYRHVLNPYHVSMNYLQDRHQFNLITVSINVHLRGELC